MSSRKTGPYEVALRTSHDLYSLRGTLMAVLPDKKVLYKTFSDFLRLCIVGNKSLLWPDKEAWTLQNVQAIKLKMVDAPLFGNDLSFEEKLQKQLVGAEPNLLAIICDIYYVYFLPSTFITLERKQKDIRWAASLGGLEPPDAHNKIWEAQKAGFTRTGQKYHFKYSQFWLLLLFASHVKELGKSESVVSNHYEMQSVLDGILEKIPNKMDRAYDMRHAILYMTFPDNYERIISTRDKKKIIEVFGSALAETMPGDIDQALYKVRKTLSAKYDKDDRAFDYYIDLKENWKPKDTTSTPIQTESGPVTVPEEESGNNSEVREAPSETTEHTKIQWLLLKLGNDMGLDVWVARNDKNREYHSQKFSSLPRFKNDIPLTFDEASNRTIKLIDVVWLKGNEIKAAFEIESTTSIYSGILRLADLIAMQPNINIPLYLVAPDDRRSKVIDEVNRPVFSKLPRPMSQICKYIAFSSLYNRIPTVSSVVKYLSPDFLDELSESCDVEE